MLRNLWDEAIARARGPVALVMREASRRLAELADRVHPRVLWPGAYVPDHLPEPLPPEGAPQVLTPHEARDFKRDHPELRGVMGSHKVEEPSGD